MRTVAGDIYLSSQRLEEHNRWCETARRHERETWEDLAAAYAREPSSGVLTAFDATQPNHRGGRCDVQEKRE